MSYKTCSKCKKEKPVSAFHRDGRKPGGLRYDCKSCRAYVYRARRADNRNGLLQREMLRGARRRAMASGVPCTITARDIVIPDRCPILDIPLSAAGEGHSTYNSPTLDCMVPDKGYVPGNVVVLSDRANRIKSDATSSEVGKVFAWMKRKGL